MAAMNTLVAAGADVGIQDGHGFTALAWAARRGRVGVLETILQQHEPEVISADGERCTALHRATEGDNTLAVGVLIEARAGLELKDSGGQTPLCYAARKTGAR